MHVAIVNRATLGRNFNDALLLTLRAKQIIAMPVQLQVAQGGRKLRWPTIELRQRRSANGRELDFVACKNYAGTPSHGTLNSKEKLLWMTEKERKGLMTLGARVLMWSGLLVVVHAN